MMSDEQAPDRRYVQSDEELQRARVGKLTPHNAPVTLVEYDSQWSEIYSREAARVRQVLGERVLSVEHVGSTSVPGLCAKPIIDMVMAVADSANESAYVPEMEAVGYQLRIREPEFSEHRLLKGPDADINLHVFTHGDPEVDQMLLFRDHLRTNAGDRDAYAEEKRRLASRTWRHIQHYADAKTDIVREILNRANAHRHKDTNLRK